MAACAEGPPDLERRVHKAFAEERQKREWFRVSERLAAFIIETREEGLPTWALTA